MCSCARNTSSSGGAHQRGPFAGPPDQALASDRSPPSTRTADTCRAEDGARRVSFAHLQIRPATPEGLAKLSLPAPRGSSSQVRDQSCLRQQIRQKLLVILKPRPVASIFVFRNFKGIVCGLEGRGGRGPRAPRGGPAGPRSATAGALRRSPCGPAAPTAPASPRGATAAPRPATRAPSRGRAWPRGGSGPPAGRRPLAGRAAARRHFECGAHARLALLSLLPPRPRPLRLPLRPPLLRQQGRPRRGQDGGMQPPAMRSGRAGRRGCRGHREQ